jgi:hypothetical protein
MNVIDGVDNFNDVRKLRVPTFIKNCLRYFPDLQKWDAAYIADKFGDHSCTYSNDARPVRSKLETTYSDFFNRLADDFYLFSRSEYDSKNPRFISDFSFPNPLFRKSSIERHIFFAGPSQSGALPHSHGAAFNFMICGLKRWIFFDSSSDMGHKLEQFYYAKYPKDAQWIDWYNNEYEDLKKRIAVYECVQEPHDIVYIPEKFNHTVCNVNETLGIVVEVADL